MLRSLSRKISEGLQRRNISVEPLAATAFEEEPFVVFDEWLEEIEKKMLKSTCVLLCLDEYERLQNGVCSLRVSDLDL